jgi:hypothetical protein
VLPAAKCRRSAVATTITATKRIVNSALNRI